MVRLQNDTKRTGRRDFLVQCSAAATSSLLVQAAAEALGAPASPLPRIALGQYRVSRLIVGANPISGYSYLGPEMDQEMREYFTPERTVAFLQQCQREGINTHQFSPASKASEVYRRLKADGSKLQLIGLHAKREEVGEMVETLGPIALSHHGGVTDRLFRENRSGQVHDYVKEVHDRGLLAGVSAHNPDCIRRIADEGWEVDFFMTCFYYITRKHAADAPTPPGPLLEGPDVGYKFYQNDPQVMCGVIRQVDQPCLAFKILGAGRRCGSQADVREAFRFAFSHIKPTDAVIVGMYPQRFNQVEANVGYARG